MYKCMGVGSHSHNTIGPLSDMTGKRSGASLITIRALRDTLLIRMIPTFKLRVVITHFYNHLCTTIFCTYCKYVSFLIFDILIIGTQNTVSQVFCIKLLKVTFLLEVDDVDDYFTASDPPSEAELMRNKRHISPEHSRSK